MKKVLFVCNTNYQIIVAIKITLSYNYKSTLILTENLKGADSVKNKLEMQNVFDSVFVIKEKKKTSFGHILDCVFGIRLEKNEFYDEFIAFNFDILTHKIFATVNKKNENIVISQMEEGVISYKTEDTTCGVLNVSYKLRKLFKKDNLKAGIKSFYCFYPKAYNGKYQTIKIPNLSDADIKCREIITNVFTSGISQKCDGEEYCGEKYIYLPSIYDIEGGTPIGELELAKRIADYVGKDNLLVKVHPRDNMQRYIEQGLHVDNNSKTPFEAILIKYDFSKKIFITTLSGSLLNINPLFSNPPVSFYAYNLCDLSNNRLALHYKKVVDSFINSKDITLKNLRILNSLEELIDA